MNSWTENKYTALKFSITKKGKETDFDVKEIWKVRTHKNNVLFDSVFFYADFNS